MKFVFVIYIFVVSNAFSEQNVPPKEKDCIKALVDKVFSIDKRGDFYLFLPVESIEYEEARLMIKKSKLINYMLAFDSTYSNLDSMKEFTQDVLLGKRKLFFDEYFFRNQFKSNEFMLLTEKNPINIRNKNSQQLFLKKYLAVYNKYGDFYELHWSLPNPARNYKYICENLFFLNYLVVEGEESIIAVEAKCK